MAVNSEDNNEENTPQNDNNIPVKRKRGKRIRLHVKGKKLTNGTKQLLFTLRELRMERLPPHKIMHEMEISDQQYQKLMYLLDEIDSENLALKSQIRLNSEIELYKETMGIVIDECIEQIRSDSVPLEYKHEAMKILGDVAMAVVKVQVEGPRVLRSLYDPVTQFVTNKEKPLPLKPLPTKEEQKKEEEEEQTIPPSYDEEDSSEESE